MTFDGAIPVNATFFEEIIDGYFPLRESLRQMLVRNNFASACVTLRHAPIMDIPGLAPDASVPLRLQNGTAGIADRLDILVVLDGTHPRLRGAGRWHWYALEATLENTLSPLTRLAEPAIVQGLGIKAGTTQTACFGQVARHVSSDFMIVPQTLIQSVNSMLARVWGTAADHDDIRADDTKLLFDASANQQNLHDFSEVLMCKKTDHFS